MMKKDAGTYLMTSQGGKGRKKRMLSNLNGETPTEQTSQAFFFL